jgi:hypothetical protein
MKTRRNLYIEDDLWQRVCDQAKKETRSITGQIIYYIEQGLTGQPPDEDIETNLPKSKIVGGLKWKS